MVDKGRNWFAEQERASDGCHPVSAEVRRRLQVETDFQQYHRTVSKEGDALLARLGGEDRETLLEFVDALSDRSALENREHYNLGVEAGRTERGVEEISNKDPVEALLFVSKLLLRLSQKMAE